MQKQKSDPILMVAAALALITTVYVFYVTVFEQIISQNQGYFYAVIFGFILLVLFLLCNLFTKLIAISVGEQRSSYRKLVITGAMLVIAGLFLVTRMKYSTSLYPGENAIYRGAVAMCDGTYSQSHDIIESACANPAQYLYSLILAMVFRFVEPSAKPFLWTNAFFIILCGFLTYKIVRTFTNQMCGLFAAILCACIPSQTYAVYSFSSEPMVAAIFLGAMLSLISLYSYNKRVKEMDDFGDEGDRNLAGIIFTALGALLIGLLLFVEPFMIIPIVLMVIAGYLGHNSKALNMLLSFAVGIIIFVLLCFVKTTQMQIEFGKVMTGEISAFDPTTDYNSGEVYDFSEVYHSFNTELSSTDRNITDNYMFISDENGGGVYTEMTVSWVIVLNQIMYMFVLMMTISCIILAVKEQKDYVVTISMFIIGAVLMLLFQQNRDNQKFLFITVFIIASSTGLHYLYLDHHPELKVSVNALDALEKTGRKEIAAATRSNLKNAAQMTEADFVRRAKALIFIGNDEDLYQQIKDQEHEIAIKYGGRRPEPIEGGALDDYDEDFFLDKEDSADEQVKVTAVSPSGIRKKVGGEDLYQPNAEMHESASEAFNNTSIPAWKRPEHFGDDQMFDEDEAGLASEHSSFDGRESIVGSAGITTNVPAPTVEKIKRNTKKISGITPSPKKKKPIETKFDVPDITPEAPSSDETVEEPADKGKKVRKEKVKKEKAAKMYASPASNTMSGGKAVRRIKTVGSSEPAPSQPLDNPLPVPKKKEHKPIDYDTKPKTSAASDDWDFDYDISGDDDWDV